MHVVTLAGLAIVGEAVEIDVDRRQARGIEDAIAHASLAANVIGADSAVERVVAVTAEESIVAVDPRSVSLPAPAGQCC